VDQPPSQQVRQQSAVQPLENGAQCSADYRRRVPTDEAPQAGALSLSLMAWRNGNAHIVSALPPTQKKRERSNHRET
jgi:hypothetical protein